MLGQYTTIMIDEPIMVEARLSQSEARAIRNALAAPPQVLSIWGNPPNRSRWRFRRSSAPPFLEARVLRDMARGAMLTRA